MVVISALFPWVTCPGSYKPSSPCQLTTCLPIIKREKKIYSLPAAVMENRHHFLLVTYPIQSHINPALQFAKRLLRIGVHITYAISISARRRMTRGAPTPKGLDFVEFSDGLDDGFKPSDDVDRFMSEHRRHGSQTLTDIIVSSANKGRPITCLVYTGLRLPWAAEVARVLHVPSALLWIQPATVLDIYYYYYNNEDYKNTIINNSPLIELPGLPLLTKSDLPSFLDPSNDAHTFALPTFREQLEALAKETNPKILVNTFDALEPLALIAIEKLNLIAIGPLIPSAFLDGKDPSDTCFGGDLFQCTKNYIEWLNTKPVSSVVYLSFGSISILSKQQLEEIAQGLLQSGRPFLWVIRAKDQNGEEEKDLQDKLINCLEELEQHGLIVPWCNQVEVLSHPSLGCFVTHCGWNSTTDSLVCGVPVVAFPQWTDQGTNAKLVQDVWKTGVRVKAAKVGGIVEAGEINRCVEIIMGAGEKGEEMRRNAKKWKDLAREAVKEGGSSDKNLKAFVDGVVQE